MKRQIILAVLFMSIIVYSTLGRGDKMEEKIETSKRDYVSAVENWSTKDLGEMDYYLFCHTEMSTDVGSVEFVSVLIDSQTQTVEEAKALYQEFKERLPLKEEEEGNGEQDGDEGEKTEIFYVSPDCKWIVTQKWSEHQTINMQMLFHEKEKVKEKVCETSEGVNPIVLVKNKDNYQSYTM